MKLLDYVTISPRVKIFTHIDPIMSEYHLSPNLDGPVRIKEGAWICLGATIPPRVTIGEYSVIGAGAVVIEDISDFTLACGVPAKLIRKLEKIHKIPYNASSHRESVLEMKG